jgi:hypothetical protein
VGAARRRRPYHATFDAVTPRTCTERSRRIDLVSVARSHSDSSVHVSRAIRLARNHIPEL